MSLIVRSRGSTLEPAEDPSAPTPRTAHAPGDVIVDKYVLASLLDEGGMGSLWVAKNQSLDALVVLKVIRSDIVAAGADERFLTEARAAARLRHPAITRVFDFGRTSRGEPFIVMELLTGENLGDLLDREGKLPVTGALQILLPIADGLVAAHGKGVIHRDLKPDNVFLADIDGRLQPKLLDFGIARLSQNAIPDHRITQAGTVVGSPDYMAPEQARGLADIDHRSDIWAFCVLIYECLTGRMPFEDANYNALLRHIIEDEVPPLTNYQIGDDELWAILKKGFEKQRERRYQNMRELGEALARWLIARGIGEDISGHSLRAAWLDPVPSAGRVSLASISGSFPPASGIPGSIPPPSIPPAPLLHTPSAGSLPITLPPQPAASPSPLKLGLMIVAALALVAGAGFAVVRAFGTPPTVTPSAATVAAARDDTAQSAAASNASAVVPAASPQEIATAASKPAAKGTSSRDRTRSAPKANDKHASPPPSTPSKPQGGYGEDLGF